MSATFQVKTPGPFTTVQDLGRIGYQRMGIPVSGALDLDAARIANILVGNPQNQAVLELTISGPTLEVMQPVDVALTGAHMGIKVNGQKVPSWRSFRVQSGDQLSIQMAQNGCRSYLAVTGGIDVPKVMASRSTYVGAKLGGYQGRLLMKDDIIHSFPGELLSKSRQLPKSMIPSYKKQVILRVIPGPQDDFFKAGLATLLSADYAVSPQSDRMGCRLQGLPIRSDPQSPQSIISEPTIPGSIQIPPDKQPIILLTEQTIGGYAKIATVISIDIAKVAQVRPGDILRFQPVDLATAYRLVREAHERLAGISAMF